MICSEAVGLTIWLYPPPGSVTPGIIKLFLLNNTLTSFSWIKIPGYTLEKNFDRFWRLVPRFEEWNMTDITDDDLMSRYDYIEHNVDSIEECAR